MKKIFTLSLTLSAFFFTANAQLLVDDFNYTGVLTANGWNQTGTNSTEPISTTTGLTYDGYAGSGVGNAANITGVNQDVAKSFTNVTGEGSTVYLSALVRITDLSANTGGYFMHLGDSTTNFSAFAARIFVKQDASGNVNFGISNSSTATYGTTNFAVNTTYLLVVKYTISIAGNDPVSLWIIPSGVPVDEASLGTPEATVTNTAGQNNIDAVGLRQAAGIPDVVVDGLRIGTAYNQVVVLPLNLTSFKGSLIDNAVKLNWTSANESNVKDYTIEKSVDGAKYVAIGKLDATNISQATYSFTDANAVAGNNFYRLAIADKDGSLRRSSVVTIINSTSLTFRVFPNPVVSNIVISHSKATKGAAIRILNIEGKQLRAVPIQQGATQTSVFVNDLKQGGYIISYQNGSENSVTRFVKQ